MSSVLDEICHVPCHWVGEHLQYCKPIKNDVSDENSLWSWKPENSEWLYLLKIHGYTLVYVPLKDELFFVNPQYNLRSNCPNLSVFLCQCVKDPNSTARILVLDLLCENNQSVVGMSALQRYSKLRLFDDYFIKPNVSIQWCGNKEVLNEKFFKTLPHQVDSLIALCSNPGFVEASRFNSLLLISFSSINSFISLFNLSVVLFVSAINCIN